MQTYKIQKKLLALIYLGLCTPVIVYFIKLLITNFELHLDLPAPPYLKIYTNSQDYYIPKSDYIAFCLPVLAIALGHMKYLIENYSKSISHHYLRLFILMTIIFIVLLLFYFQNIKNGMLHAAILIIIFIVAVLRNIYRNKLFSELKIIIFGLLSIIVIFSLHIQKNESWKNFIADVNIAWQTDQYDYWKYAGEKGHPVNQLGAYVSVTNYDRVAWMKIGSTLPLQNPWGYGLVEDSFKRMVKINWPEASNNLSHSHSGWLDFLLAFGFPGFICLFCALVGALWLSNDAASPWSVLAFWGLLANLLLWTTTEVSATVTLCLLVFWISISAGLVLKTNLKY